MPYRLTLHWSVGKYNQTFNDYHYCITYDSNTKTAKVVKGIYKPEDNDNTSDGKYAPHCKMANTGNIGIGICAMLGYKSAKDVGNYPITQQQIELAFELIAELCVKYNIKLSEVQTHYERDRKLAKPSGKIDITWLPYSNEEIKKNTNKDKVTNESYGEFIRNKVKWYLSKKNKNNLKLI